VPNLPPSATFGLALSDRADRSNARSFAGSTLSGDAYVFLTPVYPAQPPADVRFFVDGRLVQVEKQAGYDLGGGMSDRAYPFDTFRLADGDHVLDVRLRFVDGREEYVRAPFRVDNAGRIPPARPFQLAVAADPLGAGTRLLDGANVSGPAWISLVGATASPIDHVLFYVDADLVGYDQDAPYELGPNLGGMTQPFDPSGLGRGAHMSQAIVFFQDGSLLTVNATFTVS
jgi:hypothetical protein